MPGVAEGSTVRDCKKNSKKFVKELSNVSKKFKKGAKNGVEGSTPSKEERTVKPCFSKECDKQTKKDF
ncbi:MAG: hypothetical protein JSV85_03915 [Candidatus Bathyarchaeota archaeon]|nr:MAG: hypothetical protein JSV85_03915 [Candidatus Bathyarchaeota archaeon]